MKNMSDKNEMFDAVSDIYDETKKTSNKEARKSQVEYVKGLSEMANDKDFDFILENINFDKLKGYEIDGVRLALENYIENGSKAGINRWKNQSKADKNERLALEFFGDKKKTNVSKTFSAVLSVPQLIERIGGGISSGAKLGVLSNHIDYMISKNKANHLTRLFNDLLKSKLDKEKNSDKDLVASNRMGVMGLLEQLPDNIPNGDVKGYVLANLKSLRSIKEEKGSCTFRCRV